MAKVIACLITFPNPAPTGDESPTAQEIYLNAREGLLRVLALITSVEAEHLSMSLDDLEEAISEAEDHSDGSVEWTFVQVMDLNVVGG